MLAEFESFDTGLPITQAHGQAARAAENFRYFAEICGSIHEDAFRSTAQIGYSIRRPKGVAGLITPWNMPFMLATWKLAPASPPAAPSCSSRPSSARCRPACCPEIMEEAGVPTGVFNVVHGLGEEAGAALVAHPDVPVISFTGETTTGQIIMRSAAEHLKGLSMELGGKSPCVVFADADLRPPSTVHCSACSRSTASAAPPARACSSSARCTTSSSTTLGRAGRGDPHRRSRRSGDRARRADLHRALRPGDVVRRDRRSPKGPASSPAASAPTICRPATTSPPRCSPTCDADMRIFQEEIFGPVVCVTPFDDEDEAIRLANDTRYGLAAYVWTNDLRRGHRVAHRLEAGMVWLNSHNVRDLRTPFGGVKASGLGREGGEHSVDFYTETQHRARRARRHPRPTLREPT